MLYICKLSNKFDLNRTIRVSHTSPTNLVYYVSSHLLVIICQIGSIQHFIKKRIFPKVNSRMTSDTGTEVSIGTTRTTTLAGLSTTPFPAKERTTMPTGEFTLEVSEMSERMGSVP